MKSAILASLLAVVFLQFDVDAALRPQVSEELAGKRLQSFQTQTLDGKTFSSSALQGKSVVYNFFTSWCPACQQEISQIRKVFPELKRKGIVLIGILADSLETPDTVVDAIKDLSLNPLPYPVIMMTPAMRNIFRYEGFPATYFVSPEGTFSTTLYGVQPSEQIQAIADRIAGSAPGASGNTDQTNGTPLQPQKEASPEKSSTSVTRHHSWESHPLLALLPEGWEDWHPIVIHFPIVLLVLEAVFIWLYLLGGHASFDPFSKWLLWVAVASFLPVIATGIRDSGMDLGPGSPFLNGLKDRINNFLRLESSVSLHVLFSLSVVLLASVRLIWRSRSGRAALKGGKGYAYAITASLGLWLLFAAGQVGGGISHP